MTLLLTDLPPELVQRIIIFAGSDTKTLLRCEKTCRLFRDVISDDKTWARVGALVVAALSRKIKKIGSISNDVELLPLSFFKTHREYACVTNAILRCCLQQQNTRNILIRAVGEGWEHLVESTYETFSLDDRNTVDYEGHRVTFRSDSLFTLAEVVQEGMIRLIRGAHETSCAEAAGAKSYPILTGDHLRKKQIGLLDRSIFDDELANDVIDLMPEVEFSRDSIVIMLSHRAGVVRMTNEAAELVWAAVFHMIALLIRPACTELICINKRGDEKCAVFVGGPRHTVYSVPPLSLAPMCDECEIVHEYIHTVVPKQIEDAARSLRITDKVYGHFGLSHTDTWQATAASRYEFQWEEGEDGDEESDLNMDFYEEDSYCMDIVVYEDESNDEGESSSDGSEETENESHEELMGAVIEVRHEDQIDLEDISNTVESENDALGNGLDEWRVEHMEDGDDEDKWAGTTRNAHHCVIS